jgi:hypothetical protein
LLYEQNIQNSCQIIQIDANELVWLWLKTNYPLTAYELHWERTST